MCINSFIHSLTRYVDIFFGMCFFPSVLFSRFEPIPHLYVLVSSFAFLSHTFFIEIVLSLCVGFFFHSFFFFSHSIHTLDEVENYRKRRTQIRQRSEALSLSLCVCIFMCKKKKQQHEKYIAKVRIKFGVLFASSLIWCVC